MSFTSVVFALFIILTITCYFLLSNKKWQWVILLIASYIFYLWADARYAIYILITTVSAFFGARRIEQINLAAKETIKQNKQTWSREERNAYKGRENARARSVMVLVLLLNFGVLFLLKYFNALLDVMGRFTAHTHPTLQILMPLGISFYTFQTMSYVIDVYRGSTAAERNPAKLALFVSFFPQILQGPISRYDQLAPQLFASHKADFTRFKYGAELMLWGYFKKLVIADRAVIAISAVTAAPEAYNGSALAFIVLLYALQLYADFSAGIDIIRGIAQILGIDMIQNFRQPYFATSLSDYWNRWHISLGAWMKDYIFFPLALSKVATRFTKSVLASRFGKSRLGSYIAKVLPGTVASLIVFLVVGIWHGVGMRYILYGLYNGGIIMLSTLFKPCLEWANRTLHINTKSFLHHLFQILRTFLLVCIGNITDLIGPARDFFTWLTRIATDWSLSLGMKQIFKIDGLTKPDYLLLALCVPLLFGVGVLRERNPLLPLRCVLERWGTFTQWILILCCIIAIIVFGMYGPGYNAADFVYVQF